MIVKNKDTENLEHFKAILYDPGAGEVGGKLFKGWSLNSNYSVADADRGMTIDDVRNMVKERTPFAEGGEPLKVYAMLYNQIKITYLGEGNISLGTDTILHPSNETVPESGYEYTVLQAYTPKDPESNFEGWHVDEGANNIIEQQPVYPNNTKIHVKGDVKFSVDAPKGHWLIFDEQIKGATYNAPQFIKSGETTSEPRPASEMVLNGYDFNGWYTDKECTTQFDFGNELTETITIYAKWTEKTEAEYTVIVWTQNLDMTGYDFGDSIKLSGPVGQTISSVEQKGQGNDAYAVINGNDYRGQVSDSLNLTGFHLKDFDNNKSVSAQGNTVVNVYYDRTEYTLTFIVNDGSSSYVKSDSTNSGYYYMLTDDGRYVYRYLTREEDHWTYETGRYIYSYEKSSSTENGTYYLPDSSGNYYPQELYRNEGKWYKNRRRVGGLIFGHWEYYNEYVGDVYNRISTPETDKYNGDVYIRQDGKTIKTITAKYGESIAEHFPITGADGTSYEGYVWSPQGSQVFTTGDVPSLEIMPAENTIFIANRYGTSRYAHFIYYVEALPGETGDVSYNNKQYKEHEHLKISIGNGVTSTKSEDFKKLTGFTEEASTPSYGSDGRVELNSGNNYTIKFYYKRNTYSIRYCDGIFVDGNDNLLEETPRGDAFHTSDAIKYQADLTTYNKGQKDYYIPGVADTPKGYVFDGWYIDDTCTSPYTFEEMPEGGIQVYAKWRQVQYRVFLHPNAYDDAGNKDASLNWGSDQPKMNFRVDLGGKVSTPTGIRNEYEMVGWYLDSNFTKIFNKDAFVLNEDTVTTPYNKETDFTDPMDAWGDGATENADVNRPWITKKLDLYAKWRKVLEGADGIKVIYDANQGSNAPIDDNLYPDSAKVIAGAASTAPDATPKLGFSHWVIQKWDTDKYVDTDKTVFAGASFEIKKDDAQAVVTQWVNPTDEKDFIIVSDPTPGTTPPDSTHTKIKAATYTVQLRAEYINAEELTPTHIRWFSNDGTFDSVEEDIVLDDNLHINQAVDIKPASTFRREGYEFVGWARVKEEFEDEQAGELKQMPELTKDSSEMLVWYKDGSFYTDKNCTAANKVEKVAADEILVDGKYQAMYAVWKAETRKLKVSKTITGDGLPYVNLDAGFTIKVTLTDATGSLKTAEGISEVVKNNADDEGKKAEIELTFKPTMTERTAEQELIVPYGVEYNVEEQNIPKQFTVSYDKKSGTVTGKTDEVTSTTVTNTAKKVPITGVDVNTSGARTALLSLFAFAMMCVLGFSLKRKYVSRR